MRWESRLAPAMWEGTGGDVPLLRRGSPKALGPLAPRQPPAAFAVAFGKLAGSGRLELAEWLCDPRRNPYGPRVAVNRAWQALFGRGLAGAPDNFGVLGEAPSHPELLDRLASEFVRDGWSVKRLLRRLALSRAYAMSSRGDPSAEERDPANRWLHRMPVRRLDAEALRDGLLAVSGRLDPTLFGPPVATKLSAFQDGRGRPADGPPDGAGRRSIYLSVRRNFLDVFQQAFDAPSPSATVGRRTVSNVPAQALALLNEPLLRDLAGKWATAECVRHASARTRAAAMWQAAFARPATDAELLECLEFVRSQAALRHAPPAAPPAWADLAHALFNAKEFAYLR